MYEEAQSHREVLVKHGLSESVLVEFGKMLDEFDAVQFHFNQLFMIHDLEIVGRAFHSPIVSVDRGSNGVGLTTGTATARWGPRGHVLHLRQDR